MSYISPQGEQSTISEITCLEALNNLPISGSGQAIRKSGTFEFENIDVGGGSVSSVWGSITGTLSNQIDLQTKLNNKQPLNARLTEIAGLTPTDSYFIVGDGTNFITETGATARTSIGLGSVENTTLSTWIGTTNITTLGTIGTGTWNATLIGVIYGGTGLSAVASGSILVANSANVLSALTSTSGLKVVQNNAGTLSWVSTTGTGSPVFHSGPSLTAPTLGAATATSINKITLTQPANGATLTIINGKTLTVSKTIQFTSPDDTSVITLPAGANTLLATNGSAASLTDFPTLNQNTTGTAANLSGTPDLPNGTTATTQAPADNSTKLATTAYADAAGAAGGATPALDNLASVAINTSLLSDTADTDSLGSTTKEWLNLYIGDAGKIYLGLEQDLSIHRSGANVMTLTASSGVVISAGLTVNGTLSFGANAISGTGGITGGIITALAQLISSIDSDTPSTCALIDLRKARDGDPTDDVSDNDYLGEIRFRGYHTAGYHEGAIIRAVVNGTPGDGDMPTELIFATSADASATPTTRLTIDATGLATFANGIAGALTGNVDGNCTGSSGSCTGNAATVTNATFTTALTVDTGTLTLTAHADNDSVLTIGKGASSISGANTGDQTDISGNAATVTGLSVTAGKTLTVTESATISGALGTGAYATIADYAPLANPTFTGTVILPKAIEIQDTSADHQYVLAVSELTADRTITLPLLTGADEFVFKAHTQTLTNKRITKRVVTTADDATAVIDVDVTDVYELSAIANATEFTLTGTPTDGQMLIVRFKDAGVTKGLTWTGFTAIGVTLPTATVAGKWHYVGCTYNLVATQWQAIAVGVQA